MTAIKQAIKTIKDFPHKGILFKDLTPLLLKPKLLNACIKKLKSYSQKYKFDIVIAPEARGF
jgi:adenine phosphoribosyltransferase